MAALLGDGLYGRAVRHGPGLASRSLPREFHPWPQLKGEGLAVAHEVSDGELLPFDGLRVLAQGMKVAADYSGLLPMQRTLGLVDHVVDLVLRMVDLLFGFASATVGLAFGFKVLVAREASGRLFGLTLYLITLCTHHAHPSSSQ
jgi:hypothetical protein